MVTSLYSNKLTKLVFVLSLLIFTSCLDDPISNQIEDNFLSSIIVLDGTYITCSSEGSIYKSDNAIDWEFVPTTNSNLLLSLDGTGDIAICSGENGTILVSTDKGSSWEAKVTGVSGFLKNVKIINDSTYIASGESGTVIISTDYGETWGQLETEFTSTINDMNVLDGVVYLGLRSADEPTELLYRFDIENSTLEVINFEFESLITDISVVNNEIYLSDFKSCYLLTEIGNSLSLDMVYSNNSEIFIIEDVVDYNGKLVLVGSLGFNFGKLVVDATGTKQEIEFEESLYFISAIVNDNKVIACGGDELELLIYDGSSSEIIKLK